MARRVLKRGLWLGVAGLVLLFVGFFAQKQNRSDETRARASEHGATRVRTRPTERHVVSIGGLVLDAEGAPLEGARVTLTEFRLDFSTDTLESAPVAIADGKGRWQLTGVTGGRYTATAAARGFRPAHVELVVAAADQSNIEFRLARGGTELSGRVTDFEGGPIAGAIVRANRLNGLLSFVWGGQIGMTDERGYYELALEPGAHHVRVAHPDYCEHEAAVEVGSARVQKDFQLVPGGVVAGRVVTRLGKEPVADAVVSVAGGPGGLPGFVSGIALQGASTDASGRFVLRGVRAGTHQLRATGQHIYTQKPKRVELGIGEEIEEVVIEVDPAFTISGVVVRKDRQPEEPIAGTLIGAYNFQPGMVVAAPRPSDSDGSFEIRGVPPGNYLVAALTRGALPNPLATQVTVSEADVTGVVVALDSGRTVRGRVEPPGLATVRLERGVESFSFTQLPETVTRDLVRAETDASGQFALSAVPPGQVVVVAETLDGKRGRTELAADQEEVVVRLEPAPAVAGRVVDRDGAPVAGVRVSIESAEAADPTSRRRFAMLDRALGRAPAKAALTDATGQFRLTGLSVGTHQVQVSGETGPVRLADGRSALDIDVPGGGLDELVLTVERSVARIAGTVQSPDGEPIADAWVKLDGQSRLTGEDGRFEFVELAAGVYDLEAEADRGRLRGRLSGVKSGTSAAVVVLAATASIAGTVTTRAGQPIRSYVLKASRAGWNDRQSIADEAGQFSLAPLEPGSYTLEIISPLGSARVPDVTVAAGQSVTRDITVSDWGQVRGRVLELSSGKPLAGLWIVWRSADGAKDYSEVLAAIASGDTGKVRTASDGSFHLQQLSPGKGTLVAMSGELSLARTVASTTFTIGAGESRSIGDLYGVDADAVPADQRGSLALTTAIAPGPDSDGEQLWIAAIAPNGPADKAGALVGDRILAIDQVVVGAIGLRAARSMLEPGRMRRGQTVKLEVERAGARTTIAMTATGDRS